MEEEYVNFETAKLLKEKGFDWNTLRSYDKDGKIKDILCPLFLGEDTAMPTLQAAMKWLREVHNIAIETEWEHLWYAYIKPMTSNPTEDDYYQCSSAKYEEAIEAAIKYCLENLI